MGNYLQISDNFANFVAWIGGSCKPSDKGKLTAFPRFNFCQQNLINVSNMLRFEELPEINSERWLSIEDLPDEEWKDVVGYENVLSISCYGRLKRKERLSFNPHNNGYCRYKEKIIRNQSTKLGYQHVSICVGDNRKINLSYHRMVMEAFVPNMDNLPFINHRDENPRNNCVYNLEWCTPKYNSNYGTVNERRRIGRIEKGTTRKVILYDYDGNVIKRYETVTDVERDLQNITKETVINCCRGITDTAKGYHFRFEGEDYKPRIVRRLKNAKCQVFKGDVLVFSSTLLKEVSCFLGIDYCTIWKLIRGDTKFCKKIKDYNIYIEKCDGVQFKIINGRKV